MVAVKEPTAAGMAVRTAATLFLFVVVFTSVLAGAYFLTKDALAASAAEEKLRLINEVLPPALYDNALLDDTLPLPATAELGLKEASTVYRARRGGQPVALVLESVAPDGYAGKIRLLIAIKADGSVAGVRVMQHKETPGLGDYIEPKKDKNKERPWITQFDGLSLEKLPLVQWKVKKDGGQFDSVAGATVTPRAVVKAVKKAVEYVTPHRDEWFQATAAKS